MVVFLISTIVSLILSICFFLFSEMELGMIDSATSMDEYRKRNIRSCIYQALAMFLMFLSAASILSFVYFVL